MEPIGGDVFRTLARFGPAAGMAEIVRVWADVVGPGIARNAWPARIARDGTLHVSASSSTWAFELGQLAPDLLGRLRERLGAAAPRALRFAPGPLPERAQASVESAAAPAAEPTAAEQALAATLVAGIDDAELRELVARAAAVSLARQASSR